MSFPRHDFTAAHLAGCFNKVSHGNWNEAEHAAIRMRRKHGTAFQPYKCRACGWYHVGEPMP